VRHLCAAEREEISRGLVAGRSVRSIAAGLGRAPSTISREIVRNGGVRQPPDPPAGSPWPRPDLRGAAVNQAQAAKDVNGEVLFLARELKAPVIAATFTALGDQARDQNWSREEYLAAVLGRQVASGAANGTKMRLSAARFPQIKALEDFTFEHLPTAPRDVIAHLATTTFVARKENIVLLGPPGTGKTHLAIALAIKAAEATYRCSTPPPDGSPAWPTPTTTAGSSPSYAA
jgi:IstB-like ATP binding protein/Helix-turn-helix domain